LNTVQDDEPVSKSKSGPFDYSSVANDSNRKIGNSTFYDDDETGKVENTEDSIIRSSDLLNASLNPNQERAMQVQQEGLMLL